MDTMLDYYLDRIHALEARVRELEADAERRAEARRTGRISSIEFRAARRANEVV